MKVSIKRDASIAGVLIVLAVADYVARDGVSDVPLWVHVVGWYLGVAIWFSLAVPMRTGRDLDNLKDVGPGTRVLGGLLWPLIVIVWVTARMTSLFR